MKGKKIILVEYRDVSDIKHISQLFQMYLKRLINDSDVPSRTPRTDMLSVRVLILSPGFVKCCDLRV